MRKNTCCSLCILLFSSLLQPLVCQDYKPITVDLIYNKYRFVPYSVNGYESMSDGTHYSILEESRKVVMYDYQTGKESTVVFDAQPFEEQIMNGIDDYEFSNDENKILLVTDIEQIYRYSYRAKHYVYDMQSGSIRTLSGNEYERLATFSPDGSKVAYVYRNNLFYYDLVQDTTIQVTLDGIINSVINGAPDWVYEEEFGFTQAFCWSPDSKKLGFMRFDESRVKQYDLKIYNGLYPDNYRYKYPKAGEDNSVVTVKIYDTESKKTITVDVGSETDQYIPRIKWTASADLLGIIRLNRLQNTVDVLIADTGDGTAEVLYHEENDRFISEIDDDYIVFTGDNKNFLIRSERSGYFHYYLYSMDGTLLNPVTKGNWDVDQFAGVDEKNNRMYYTSTEDSPLQRQLYSVKLNGSGRKKLSHRSGYVEVHFSKTYQYYVSTWSDANTPPVVSVNQSDGKQIRVLTDNSELADDIVEYGFLKKEFIKIPVSDDLLLNAFIIKPPDFDPTKKYPLFISVYGGPESQDVVDTWQNNMSWQQLLAQRGIVVACIDNRGTDGRGEDFRKCTYMQLGRLESEDQIRAVQYLSGMDWIDETRIGIFGWSYGGYMSLLCLARGSGLFAMGIAVAPVTSWRFYDTVYTERFMRKPQDNPSGYDDYSPLNHAAAIHGKLLLVHGMADDNVHLQNSAEMAEKLISANKQFEMFFYPDRNHSIYGGNTRFHLYTKLTDFIMENL